MADSTVMTAFETKDESEVVAPEKDTVRGDEVAVDHYIDTMLHEKVQVRFSAVDALKRVSEASVPSNVACKFCSFQAYSTVDRITVPRKGSVCSGDKLKRFMKTLCPADKIPTFASKPIFILQL